jgi:hypothetical protein
METLYGKTHQAVGFTYDDKLQPSVLFKPKAKRLSPRRTSKEAR